MVIHCGNKYCERHLDNENSRFRIWTPFCSRYCGLFTKQNMKPSPRTITCSKCGQEGHTRRSKSCGASVTLPLALLDIFARPPTDIEIEYPLTQAKLATHLKCSQQTISYHLTDFESRGLITGSKKGFRKQWQVTPIGMNYLTNGVEEIDVDTKRRPASTMKDIVVPCDLCKKDFPLKYVDPRKGSKTFCSNHCYWKLKTAGKKSYRDYQLLKILRETGPSTAADLSRTLSNHNFYNRSYGIGSILHLWLARGIVKQDTEALYKYDGNGPLGKIVMDYQVEKY